MILSCLGVSCNKSLNEFLDKAPGVDVTENEIFTSRANAESYVSTMYLFGTPSIWGMRDAALLSSPTGTAPVIHGLLSGATDEAEGEANFSYVQGWNSGSITEGGIVGQEDIKYHGRWKAIRIANILLERIKEVPDADEAYKAQIRGEALFMRAVNHFETFKRYGATPIVNKRFATGDEAKIPRASLAETVSFMVKDCDDAVTSLPNGYPATQKGRVTKLAALALKSRILLYAASPLFNTGTPYLSMANAADNKFICYGNADNNRWKLAADAAKAVLDAAPQAGVSLIDIPANRDPSPSNLALGNYRVAWERHDNGEVIMAEKTYPSLSRTNWPWLHMYPTAMGSFWTANCPTHNFISKYEKKRDGLPQTWNPAGGDDLVTKYDELDPRFKQSIGYNGARFNAEHPIIETFAGGKHDVNNRTGAFMTKHLPEGLANNGAAVPGYAVFRLNEFYLNYAEALNEFQGPTSEAHQAINTIRTRSAMPDLPTGLTKDQFRERTRNERAIELAFEDHRFWDIRRWMIAENEGVMKGAIYGIKITRLTATTFRYLPVVLETRSFNKNMYLHPYELNEVLKGSLVQNPGWE
ncbi:MAG: RagB/SusD family nutrient uptake outer membrane protein [Chitinophagaceae bacterium]